MKRERDQYITCLKLLSLNIFGFRVCCGTRKWNGWIFPIPPDLWMISFPGCQWPSLVDIPSHTYLGQLQCQSSLCYPWSWTTRTRFHIISKEALLQQESKQWEEIQTHPCFSQLIPIQYRYHPICLSARVVTLSERRTEIHGRGEDHQDLDHSPWFEFWIWIQRDLSNRKSGVVQCFINGIRPNQCSLILETIGGMTPASVSQPNKPSCQSYLLCLKLLITIDERWRRRHMLNINIHIHTYIMFNILKLSICFL